MEKKIRQKVKRQCSRLPSVQEDPGGLLVGRDLLTVDLQSEKSRNGVKGKVHVSHSLWKMQTRALQICNGVRASGKQMTEELRVEPGFGLRHVAGPAHHSREPVSPVRSHRRTSTSRLCLVSVSPSREIEREPEAIRKTWLNLQPWQKCLSDPPLEESLPFINSFSPLPPGWVPRGLWLTCFPASFPREVPCVSILHSFGPVGFSPSVMITCSFPV